MSYLSKLFDRGEENILRGSRFMLLKFSTRNVEIEHSTKQMDQSGRKRGHNFPTHLTEHSGSLHLMEIDMFRETDDARYKQ